MKPRASKAQSDIFVWSGKYQVGIARIDKQHKKLVALVNILAKKLADQTDEETLVKVFDDLAGYATYHFRTEENLMQEWKIDADFEAGHREAHASFVREVVKARNSAHSNPQQVTTKTLTFLSRWLIQHILGTDMRMANEIMALERGLTPTEARQRAQEKMADTQEVLLRAMGELYESLAARTQDYVLANRRLKEEIALHRQAEHQLRKLSLAIEHSPVSTFITDAAGVFEYVNPKFVEVTGYTMDDLAGQTPRMLKSGDMPDEAYAAFWKSIAGKSEWFGEFHNRRKDGGLYWGKTSVTPIADVDGTVTHYLTIQEDVTERKRSEEALHRSHADMVAALAARQGQSEDLALLNEASELMQTCVAEAEVCRALAQMAERLALGCGGALALAAADGKSFVTAGVWGQGLRMQDTFDGSQCWAIRRGQLHEAAAPARELVCTHFHGEVAMPYLCLPLVVQGKVLGLLHLAVTPESGRAQWPRLVQLAAALGNAFKLALTNLRLVEAATGRKPARRAS